MCKIEPAASERVNGFKVELYQDTDAESPREWDNLGTMACWHNRYNLGDVQPSDSPQEWRERLAAELGAVIDDNYMTDKQIKQATDRTLEREMPVILPLFLYDHSGITMSTSNRGWPFCDRWDSGQVGWIYATRADILKEYNRRHLTKKLIKQVQERLIGEVETYDQYLTGDVWGYVVKCVSCGIVLDSCWGFFGSDYAMAEGKDSAKMTPACCEIVEDLAECEEEDY